MLVFRDNAVRVPAETVRRELDGQLRGPSARRLGALLLAADVETALADLDHETATAARLVDTLASAWLEDDAALTAQGRALLHTLPLPSELRLKTPEGYAFYGVDPAHYVTLAVEQATGAASVRVVGVRSIGTSLSAVARAALSAHRYSAARITVRPNGHPWDRRLIWSAAERDFVLGAPGDARFMVVDEGPGLSGSTLLAVAEALVGLGVAPARIRILASHPFDPSRLRARDAAARFSSFVTASAAPLAPPASALDLSNGSWRAHLGMADATWPACWALQERLKFLDVDGTTLRKFSGFEPYAASIRTRAAWLADAGWAPSVAPAEPGFLAYEWVLGTRPSLQRYRSLVLEALPGYLAFRARELRAENSDTAPLQVMAEHNLGEALQIALPRGFALDARQPVFVDGRMMPHEWIVQSDGKLSKTDATDHGDDHCFPGPTDIAWDLAGAVTEWELTGGEAEELCRRFARLTGDDVSGRLPSYTLAYCAFRLGVAAFAGDAGDDAERRRWVSASNRYERRARTELARIAS